jgi:hypothetical protein
MYYLYATLRGDPFMVALVEESSNMHALANKMITERLCWSDEGLAYCLADSPMRILPTLCERIAK